MNLIHLTVRYIAENIPSPAPESHPPSPSLIDVVMKLLGSITGLFSAIGSTSGLVTIYIAARQLRRINQAANNAGNGPNPPPPPPTPPPPPPGPGGPTP